MCPQHRSVYQKMFALDLLLLLQSLIRHFLIWVTHWPILDWLYLDKVLRFSVVYTNGPLTCEKKKNVFNVSHASPMCGILNFKPYWRKCRAVELEDKVWSDVCCFLQVNAQKYWDVSVGSHGIIKHGTYKIAFKCFEMLKLSCLIACTAIFESRSP